MSQPRSELSTEVHAPFYSYYRIEYSMNIGPGMQLKLKLKDDFYSAIKSGDSEALDGGTSQLGSQRR